MIFIFLTRISKTYRKRNVNKERKQKTSKTIADVSVYFQVHYAVDSG